MAHQGDLRLVIIGGGTGLSTLLRGIKDFIRSLDDDGENPIDLRSSTAIVTVTDDAGQTGELIDEFGIIPPGDIRESLVALADQESLIQRLFLHKFESEGSLGGHSFGNLFLAALVQINENNYLEAIKDASRVLRVEGNILPATIERVRLCASFEDGRKVAGEGELKTRDNSSPVSSVWLGSRDNGGGTTPCKPAALPEALDAILEADAIVLGPGGLYTS
ncbi:MAG: YvcK family protein, partial [Gammaproteobacteria bacterium]|nr:YvcK family protein [Gammaproteobacteria bacterium]